MRHVKVLPDWREQGLCRQIDGNAWFPEVGRRTDSAAAIKLCLACPVRVQCLTDAMTNEVEHEIYGIRGGLTAFQRRQLRKKTAAA